MQPSNAGHFLIAAGSTQPKHITVITSLGRLDFVCISGSPDYTVREVADALNGLIESHVKAESTSYYTTSSKLETCFGH